MKSFNRFLRKLSVMFCLVVVQAVSGSLIFSQVEDFKTTPSVLWRFSSGSSFFASPVIAGDFIYAGALDSTLYAIDIKTGKVIWRYKTKGEIRSDVCLGESDLFLNGGDGTLTSINKKTGRSNWVFRTGGESKYDFADYFHSTPVLYNQILYFGSGDGNLYAVNSLTGSLVWKFKSDGIIHSKPAIDNGKIFFGSFDGNVYALSLNNGELIWKFKTVGHMYFPKGEVQGSPAVFNKIVFIGARDYNVYALDQEKGFCRWNKAFTRGWGLSNNIHDSVLYTGTADERVFISADPMTGKEFWNRKMELLVFGNNAYSKSMLYVGTSIGKLHGINIKTGEKTWSFETETYKTNSTKYFKPDDSYRDDIYSIIKSNEEFLADQCELGGIFSTPYVSDNLIIFTSTNGYLYCLKRSN
jgi:outer membrane protein assembly factor BamB